MKNAYIALIENNGEIRKEQFNLQLAESNPWAVAEFSPFMQDGDRIRGIFSASVMNSVLIIPVVKQRDLPQASA